MAMQVRNTHRLPTIRITYRPGSKGSKVVFTAYYGRDELTKIAVNSNAIGIPDNLRANQFNEIKFELPAGIGEQLADALNNATDPHDPKWLQVGRSNGELAIVPWERLLQPALNAPLLRIPNFLSPPRFIRSRLRLLLIVSTPWNSDVEEAAKYCSLLVDIARTVSSDAEIHVFPDQETFERCQDLVGVHLHNPNDAIRENRAFEESYSKEAHIKSWTDNPWLTWITRKAGSIDHVHFVCPGMFQRDYGAIALEQLPDDTSKYSRGARGVEARELIDFLNRIGAWSVAFSAVYKENHAQLNSAQFENRRMIGLRLIADRLAWERPGPILLDNLGSEDFDPQHIFHAYQFLFSLSPEQPPACESLMLYSHPGRLERTEYGQDGYESADIKDYGEDVSKKLASLLEREPVDVDFSTLRSEDNKADLSWKSSAERLIDQVVFDKIGQKTKGSRGAIKAVERMQELLSRKY